MAAELSAGRDNSITRTRSWGGLRVGASSLDATRPPAGETQREQSWGLRPWALPSFSVEGPISGRSWRAAAHECGSGCDHVSRGRRTRTQIQRPEADASAIADGEARCSVIMSMLYPCASGGTMAGERRANVGTARSRPGGLALDHGRGRRSWVRLERGTDTGRRARRGLGQKYSTGGRRT